MSSADCCQDQHGSRHPDDSTPEPHEFRIYADDMAQVWAVVDEVDYHWAIRWKWHINKPHPRRNGKKQYFCRSNGSGGRRRGSRIYLHIEIMKRAEIHKPDVEHIYGGHLDDNEWNCKRDNLAWITPRKNRLASRNKQKMAADARKLNKNVQAG